MSLHAAMEANLVGHRSWLQARLPGARVLDGKFTAVQQAVGTPKARTQGAAWLREFVADIKASGLVAQLIARHNARGVNVAP